jgi:hypothetical protein
MNVETPIRLDLVLEGGLFNGSFHAGVLFFLKEMEKRNIVKVERISGVSIGAILGLLYFSDNLHLIADLYNLIYIDFKQTHYLKTIKQLNEILGDKLPQNICDVVNRRLYICYYNGTTCTKVRKTKYKNTYVLMNTIIKSSFVPHFIDGNMLYKNKYVDGIIPYIFKHVKDKRILYVDLFGHDKLFHFFNIKHEKTNDHRMLTGLLDAYHFFIKQQSTSMCSYVDKWNITHKFSYFIKTIVEKACVFIIILIVRVKQWLPLDAHKYAISKIIFKMLSDITALLLDTYCI